MRKTSQKVPVIITFLLLTMMFCLGFGVSQAEASSTKLSSTSKTIYVGKFFNLKVSGTSKKAKWSTSNKKVASITKISNKKNTVHVSGKKKGTATIKAKVGSKTLKCKVKVKNPTISRTSKSLKVGNSFNLSVKGSTGTIKWTTSDRKVASIKKVSNKKYKVTGIKAGTATIKAKTKAKTLKCKVTVKDESSESGSGTAISDEYEPETIVVNGVTFDVDNFPKASSTSQGGSRIGFKVESDMKIDENDIAWKISGCEASLICDQDTEYTIAAGRYDSDVGNYQLYEIGENWENLIAQVELYTYNWQSEGANGAVSFFVDINSMSCTGSFNVSAYYKGSLIRTCKVTVDDTWLLRTKEFQIAKEAEKSTWTSSMTREEKMYAVECYVRDNYTYSELDCIGGANVLYVAARDLGYKNVRYRNVGAYNGYDYSHPRCDSYGYGSGRAGHNCIYVDDVTYGDGSVGPGHFETNGHD